MQRIKNIGLLLKIIHDRIKKARVVVSGSSSLELSSTVNEPLTGRKWEFQMFPISWAELQDHLVYLLLNKNLKLG
ncbi:MAG: AAA family ATPase [Saprospiraceae bacterium]